MLQSDVELRNDAYLNLISDLAKEKTQIEQSMSFEDLQKIESATGIDQNSIIRAAIKQYIAKMRDNGTIN